MGKVVSVVRKPRLVDLPGGGQASVVRLKRSERDACRASVHGANAFGVGLLANSLAIRAGLKGLSGVVRPVRDEEGAATGETAEVPYECEQHHVLGEIATEDVLELLTEKDCDAILAAALDDGLGKPTPAA